MFMVSITEEQALVRDGFSFFPAEFDWVSYKLIFTGNTVLRSYLNSILVTAIGTTLAVLITSMASYTLANKNVRFRNHFTLFFLITMFFNAGLVPWYMVSNVLGLVDNYLALIIPSLIFTPFNLILTLNYMRGIPDSLRESAWIDGAEDITIAFRIYFPLSLPVLATIALFYGLDYWNNWKNAIMLVNNDKLYPIQYLMMQLKSQMEMLNSMSSDYTSDIQIPSESFKMAIAIVTMGPIVLLYPYLQRYFVKGLVIGSVKG